MIVRVSRARIKPGMEQQVLVLIQKLAEQRGKPAIGQRGLLIARREAEDPPGTDILALTLWEDEDSIAAALGPDWQRAVSFPSFQEVLTNAETAEYETLATRWEDLIHIAG